MFYKLKCISCQKEFDEKETSTNCLDCGDPLDCVYDFEQVKKRLNVFNIKNSALSALKYLALYPIQDFDQIVSVQFEVFRQLHLDFLLQGLFEEHFLQGDQFIRAEVADDYPPRGVFDLQGADHVDTEGVLVVDSFQIHLDYGLSVRGQALHQGVFLALLTVEVERPDVTVDVRHVL